MVRHIVMWRLKDRDAVLGTDKLAGLRECVAAMTPASVPGLIRIELGVDNSRTPDSTDLALYSEFESWKALEGYQVHPLHDEFRQLLGPLRSERRLADYEI